MLFSRYGQAVLEQQMYPDAAGQVRGGQAIPDWAGIPRELRRRNVTLLLLWEEYKAAYPDDGCGCSRSFELYRRLEGRINPTTRQHRFAGDPVVVTPLICSDDTFDRMMRLTPSSLNPV